MVAWVWPSIQQSVTRQFVLISWLNKALLIVLVVLLAQGSWLFWPPLPLTLPPPKTRLSTTPATTPPMPPLIPPLFGEATATQITPANKPPSFIQAASGDTLPTTQLPLKLSGIINAADPTRARAILSQNNEDQRYPLQAKLPGGAMLMEIHNRYIVLQNKGRLERLYLENSDSLLKATPLASKTPIATESQPERALPSFPQEAIPSPNAAPPSSALLSQHLNAEPVYQQDQLIGFKIMPKETPFSQALLERYQLAAGDVITAVNGIALNNMAAGLTALQSIQPQQPLVLAILRDQTPLTLTINPDDRLENRPQ